MLKTIDLFAGAGGLSYGFESTREFLIVAAAENNKNARKTYVENHKGRNDIRLIPDVRDYDFSALASEFDGIDVVIGGPPCQGFSNANRQKNHIISMNNSLVKEYFRAVKEIRPKAFVMENVSMLSSETHRFYDSAKDHDVVTSLGVQMREDELVLADSDYNGYSLVNIIQADAVADYKISDELFQLLNVLYKNRNSEERLSKYIKNKSKLIIDKIASQAEEVKNNLGILNWIVDMINTEQISACFTELGQFIKFQKTFRLKEELDSNEIIYEIENDLQTGKIIARVKSYSVIEYVNKILGDDYKKNSGVINSLWFGVPQERRRFIMIGVRSDIIQEKEIEMPEGNGAEIVTVGQAIGDLRVYEVDEEDNEPEKLPYDSNTENLSDYARIMRKGSEGISNHIVPKSRDKAKARFAALKEGENFHNLDNGLKDNYAVPERTQNSIYLRLDSNRPSGTVINVRKSMWIHPTIDRAISVREAARLQSFPDRFVFKGTKDAQYQQVGNAVPPLMANVTAMAHGSKLDGEIFSEFSRDWTNLSYQAQLIRAKLQNKDISEVIDLGDIDVIPAGKYRDQMMKTRVGQYFFRMTVLNSYENRCCVTGLKQPELLVASHIKPWKVSDERTERTNPANGLCLNALHDKAFDRGLITLDKRYKIIVSRKLKDTEMDSETKSWFMGYSDHQIILPDKFLPGKDFIEYHNDVIFQR